MIRFLNLQRQHSKIETGLIEAVTRVVRVGRFILGAEVNAFENEWAVYCGLSSTAGVASGTDALTLALVATTAVRPGHNDEVITSPLTAGYTAIAILKAGGVPVLPQAERVGPRLLSLPLYPQLEIEEAYEVVSAIRSFK